MSKITPPQRFVEKIRDMNLDDPLFYIENLTWNEFYYLLSEPLKREYYMKRGRKKKSSLGLIKGSMRDQIIRDSIAYECFPPFMQKDKCGVK